MRVDIFLYLQRCLRYRAFLPSSGLGPGGKHICGELQKNLMKQKNRPLCQLLAVFSIVPADPQKFPELRVNRTVLKYHCVRKAISGNQRISQTAGYVHPYFFPGPVPIRPIAVILPDGQQIGIPGLRPVFLSVHHNMSLSADYILQTMQRGTFSFNMVPGVRPGNSRHFNSKPFFPGHLSGKEGDNILHLARIPHLYAYFFYFIPFIIAVYFNHRKSYMPPYSGARIMGSC